MNNPGGPYWQQEPQPQYQVDPMTGQPVNYQPQQQAYPQQQPQQQGGYQGFGMYQQQPPPQGGGKNRKPLVIALAAVLVVAIGVTATLLLTGKDDEPSASPGSQPGTTTTAAKKTSDASQSKPTSSTVRAPDSTSRTVPKTPTEIEDIKVDPVIIGWQGVWSYKEGVAYDVPPEWIVESPGVLAGFEDNNGKPTAIMHGISTYRKDACPAVKGSFRGRVGMVTADDLELTVAARGGVKLFADSAALNKDNTKAPVTSTEPVATKVNQGKIDALTATATMTVNQPGECPAPSVLFTSVAFKLPNGKTALFLMYMDQGVPDTLPKDVADQIISSLRPLER